MRTLDWVEVFLGTMMFINIAWDMYFAKKYYKTLKEQIIKEITTELATSDAILIVESKDKYKISQKVSQVSQ